MVLRELHISEGIEARSRCQEAIDYDHGKIQVADHFLRREEYEGLFQDQEISRRRLLLPCLPQGPI